MNAFLKYFLLAAVLLNVETSKSILTWTVDVANSEFDSTDLFLDTYSKLENILKANFATLTEKLDKVENEISQLEIVARNLAEENKKLENKVDSTSQELESKIGKQQNEIDNNSNRIGKEWVSGKYCFLANGNCPAGFTTHSGHMRAINMYAASSTYITPVTFGSSHIQCHGSCGQYGNWIGELVLTVCCK